MVQQGYTAYTKCNGTAPQPNNHNTGRVAVGTCECANVEESSATHATTSLHHCATKIKYAAAYMCTAQQINVH